MDLRERELYRSTADYLQATQSHMPDRFSIFPDMQAKKPHLEFKVRNFFNIYLLPISDISVTDTLLHKYPSRYVGQLSKRRQCTSSI